MVKFGSQLKDDAVKEWQSGYVDYDALKNLLYQLVRSGKCLRWQNLCEKPVKLPSLGSPASKDNFNSCTTFIWRWRSWVK